MKAIYFEQHGGPEVLRYGDLPEPTPMEGEALVRVRAVALNHLDIWVRRGWEGLNLPLPHIGGSDVVGEVISAPSDSSIPVGTRVAVTPGFSTREDEWTRRGEDSVSPGYKIIGEQVKGGMAEYLAAPVSALFPIPESLSYEEAVVPLLVGTTCWRMLFNRGGLKAGESVLIVGSGGGVNSLSILLCKYAGATVYCLAGSGDKARKAEALGADVVINYKDSPNWPSEIMKLTKGRGVDLVVDNVGAETFTKSLRVARRGGRIVTVGNTTGYTITFDNRLIFAKQLSLIGSTMGSKQDFIDATNVAWRFNLKSLIDTVAPLHGGIEMLRRLEDGKQFGKIVLTP